jgi:hypothetical protein
MREVERGGQGTSKLGQSPFDSDPLSKKQWVLGATSLSFSARQTIQLCASHCSLYISAGALTGRRGWGEGSLFRNCIEMERQYDTSAHVMSKELTLPAYNSSNFLPSFNFKIYIYIYIYIYILFGLNLFYL